MNLAVVYGLKTADPAWFDAFYPSRRLTEECKNRSIPLRFLFPQEVPALLAELAVADFSVAAGRSATGTGENRTVFLVRGDVPETTYILIENAGFPCINGSRPSSLARDKLETARFLEAGGWPTPATFQADALPAKPTPATFQTDALPAKPTPATFQADALPAKPQQGDQQSDNDRQTKELPLPFPFVVKPRFGSRGNGVQLVRNRDELEQALRPSEKASALQAAGTTSTDRTTANTTPTLGTAADTTLNGGYIIQQYIESSRGRDVRYFFAGGEVIAVAERRAESDAFLSNACTGGRMHIPEYRSQAAGESDPWEQTVLDIAREAGLWYGTVDFLFLENGTCTPASTPASTSAGETGETSENGEGYHPGKTGEGSPTGETSETGEGYHPGKTGEDSPTGGTGRTDGHGRHDGIFTPGIPELTVCEINHSPGFEALERDCGYNIAGTLVELLLRDFGG